MRIKGWRVLLAAGLVLGLVGVLFGGKVGAEAFLVGVICLVAGAVWGLVAPRGTREGQNPT